MNRDKLEQEAMDLLRRGQSERALERYLAILRHDPRDRRIRQKVAELYLSLGRRPEAARHFTDVARAMQAAGQQRQAASLFKQLVDLKPDDHETLADYATCLSDLGRKSEARAVWEDAFRLVERRDPRVAVTYAEKVARLSPGETPPKVRVAELLESNRREDEAFEHWTRLAAEARRFGRPDDQARFLERALKLRTDDLPSLLDAAEARIVQGEVRQGLAHLQYAYSLDSSDVRLLGLLGRGLQELGQAPKARKVWLQAAQRHAELGNREAQVEALRHALECGDADPRIQAELDRADAEAARQRMRLHDKDWAQPGTEAELRCVVRARTQMQYGFPDLARTTLERADAAVKSGVSWKVHMAELLLVLGEPAAAVGILRGVRPPSDAALRDLAERLEVLGTGGAPAPASLTREETEELIEDDDTAATGEHPPEPVPEIAPPREEVTSPFDFMSAEEVEAEGDRLADEGDVQNAIAAYRRVLSLAPSNTHVLMKIGEVMSGSWNRQRVREDHSSPIAISIPEPDAEPEVDFGAAFGEVDPDAIDHLDDAIGDARALLEVGEYEASLDRLRGMDDIEALVVQAQAARALGRLDSAQGRLERAVQAGSEHHPAYIEALWELAGIYLLRHKLGNAERILDEAALIDPTWRPVEMAARRRGIELLRQR